MVTEKFKIGEYGYLIDKNKFLINKVKIIMAYKTKNMFPESDKDEWLHNDVYEVIFYETEEKFYQKPVNNINNILFHNLQDAKNILIFEIDKEIEFERKEVEKINKNIISLEEKIGLIEILEL